MKKPAAAAIRRALPLSQTRKGGLDPIRVCSICGLDVDPKDLPSEVWRECDEYDTPIPGDDRVLFIGQGKAHEACQKVVNAHPRLYVEQTGLPGHFPALCGACVHRDGFGCRHPDLKGNGGPGLRVGLTNPFANAIVCTRYGRYVPVRHALDCAGQKLPGEETT